MPKVVAQGNFSDLYTATSRLFICMSNSVAPSHRHNPLHAAIARPPRLPKPLTNNIPCIPRKRPRLSSEHRFRGQERFRGSILGSSKLGRSAHGRRRNWAVGVSRQPSVPYMSIPPPAISHTAFLLVCQPPSRSKAPPLFACSNYNDHYAD
jgi:hypothetical protein